MNNLRLNVIAQYHGAFTPTPTLPLQGDGVVLMITFINSLSPGGEG